MALVGVVSWHSNTPLESQQQTHPATEPTRNSNTLHTTVTTTLEPEGSNIYLTKGGSGDSGILFVTAKNANHMDWELSWFCPSSHGLCTRLLPGSTTRLFFLVMLTPLVTV